MYYAVAFEIDDKILIMPLTDGRFPDRAFDVLGRAPAITIAKSAMVTTKDADEQIPVIFASQSKPEPPTSKAKQTMALEH